MVRSHPPTDLGPGCSPSRTDCWIETEDVRSVRLFPMAHVRFGPLLEMFEPSRCAPLRRWPHEFQLRDHVVPDLMTDGSRAQPTRLPTDFETDRRDPRPATSGRPCLSRRIPDRITPSCQHATTTAFDQRTARYCVRLRSGAH